MTKRALGVGAAFAVLLLIAGVGILAMTGGDGAAAAGKRSAPELVASEIAPSSGGTVAPHVTRAALPHGESAPVAPLADGDPPELVTAPIKKAYVQREDGSLRAKDAPPPLLRKTAIDGIRVAVAPAIQRCIADGFARSPEQHELDTHPSVSIIYTASAAGGSVSVTSADATINGTQDDLLLVCVEAAYKGTRIPAPSDQPEGEGKVIATFDYK